MVVAVKEQGGEREVVSLSVGSRGDGGWGGHRGRRSTKLQPPADPPARARASAMDVAIAIWACELIRLWGDSLLVVLDTDKTRCGQLHDQLESGAARS